MGEGSPQVPQVYRVRHRAGRINKEASAMSKIQHSTPRMPATKFAHLRKKMQQQKSQAKQPKKK